MRDEEHNKIHALLQKQNYAEIERFCLHALSMMQTPDSEMLFHLGNAARMARHGVVALSRDLGENGRHRLGHIAPDRDPVGAGSLDVMSHILPRGRPVVSTRMYTAIRPKQARVAQTFARSGASA